MVGAQAPNLCFIKDVLAIGNTLPFPRKGLRWPCPPSLLLLHPLLPLLSSSSVDQERVCGHGHLPLLGVLLPSLTLSILLLLLLLILLLLIFLLLFLLLKEGRAMAIAPLLLFLRDWQRMRLRPLAFAF